MSEDCVLITGGYGCIGAETTKWLIRNSTASVVVCGRSVNEARTERVFADIDRSRITFLQADVTDQDRLESILHSEPVNRVVHLGALQTPDCNANRDLGLQINLAGTQNLIEAIKTTQNQVQRFVFASSIAVYGPRASYPSEQVPMLAEPKPVNVYGTWKLAGEHLTRLFSDETGTSALSLRPGVLFGPGRDAGLTSTPTTAMKAVALSEAYQIPFASKQDYAYAPDIGAAFAHAAMEPFDGYGTFTLPSKTVNTAQMVDEIQAAARSLNLDGTPAITVGSDEVPFICDLEYQPFLDEFPNVPQTPLDQAVRQSIEVFAQQVERGWLSRKDLG